jgi:hypothetical protein
MTIEQLRTAHPAQPFRPFVIHLADGRAEPVEHREFIMTVPSGRTVVIAQPDDTLNIIDLLLVTDLEIKPTTSGGEGANFAKGAKVPCGWRSQPQPAPPGAAST